MARTLIGRTDTSRTGVTVVETVADVVDGNAFDDDGSMRVFLLVFNAHGSLSRNLTINTPGNVDGLATPDRVVAIAALARVLVGPFPGAVYSNGGQVWFDGETTDLKFTVIRPVEV